MVKIVPILPRKYTRVIDTIAVYIASIKDKSLTKVVLDFLKEKYPVDLSLRHLKRIRSTKDHLQIIITQVINVKSKDILETDGELCTLLENYQVALVASSPPYTRKQFTEASAYWPTSFHEDKHIKLLIEGNIFTKDDDNKHTIFFQLVEEVAYSGKEFGMQASAAVIVDPEKQHVLAAAFDCSKHCNPLYHSPMVAIDMVATLQGGGCYEELKYTMSPNGYIMLDPSLFSQKENNLQTSWEACNGYLCTGYDVYLSQEPCVMCSMALLHSRVRRVFYKDVNVLSGGLGSIYEIHCEGSLNHHFEVFKVMSSKRLLDVL